MSKSTIILLYMKYYGYIDDNDLYVYKKIFLLVESLINITLR